MIENHLKFMIFLTFLKNILVKLCQKLEEIINQSLNLKLQLNEVATFFQTVFNKEISKLCPAKFATIIL